MGTSIVITTYGTGKTVNDFTVTLFENERDYGADKSDDYCSIINGLELKDDKWIYAFKVKENQKFKIADLRESNFDILSTLDNRSMQKVLREVDSQELAKALKSAEKETIKAVLRNMSKRAAR
ncbi:FliG C-terminal domain-containing protein, partial [Treponema sp. R8-4-B8]